MFSYLRRYIWVWDEVLHQPLLQTHTFVGSHRAHSKTWALSAFIQCRWRRKHQKGIGTVCHCLVINIDSSCNFWGEPDMGTPGRSPWAADVVRQTLVHSGGLLLLYLLDQLQDRQGSLIYPHSRSFSIYALYVYMNKWDFLLIKKILEYDCL